VPRAILPALAAAEAFPGPGPWDARAWAGAALYAALFLAALWGAWRLARGALPPEEVR
jgi:hypothetical protein